MTEFLNPDLVRTGINCTLHFSAVTCGVLKVKANNRKNGDERENMRDSRKWSSASLFCAGIFYSYNAFHDPSTALVVGAFGNILAAGRSFAVWQLDLDPKDPKQKRLQKYIARGTASVVVTVSLGAQVIFNHTIDRLSAFSVGGIFFGCEADATSSKEMRNLHGLLGNGLQLIYTSRTGAYGIMVRNGMEIVSLFLGARKALFPRSKTKDGQIILDTTPRLPFKQRLGNYFTETFPVPARLSSRSTPNKVPFS